MFADGAASAEYNRVFNPSRAAFKSARFSSRTSAHTHFAANAAWGAMGRPLEPGSNPFEPLLAIWSMGYAVYAIRRRALTLLAPAIEPD